MNEKSHDRKESKKASMIDHDNIMILIFLYNTKKISQKNIKSKSLHLNLDLQKRENQYSQLSL